jgi:hypothetical protein
MKKIRCPVEARDDVLNSDSKEVVDSIISTITPPNHHHYFDYHHQCYCSLSNSSSSSLLLLSLSASSWTLDNVDVGTPKSAGSTADVTL